ncbi:MAG TPA: hypothetical protein VFR58_09835 [Flavisolibacter sp.]|nr:hypothetical protein [Flavisolibacter sp.]
MKKPLLFFVFLFALGLTSSAQAQRISAADLRILRKKEDSLKSFVKNVMIDSFTAGRMRSDSQFVKTLVRGLQVKNSFYFPFDSVQGIGKLYAPDSSFRIITWQISYDDYYCRQRGAIQYNTDDGRLSLVPLWDASEFSDRPEDSVRSKNNWIGAVYYNIIQTKHNGKDYYTLFGFDGNSVRSNKKWIEVLSFDERNMPVFGGRYFSFEKDSVKRPEQHRFSIEYKKEASTTVNYDPDLKMILIDHLVSETDEPELAHTYVPDGDYEGFKWVNGKWLHVDKVFTEVVDMRGVDPYLGKPPVGDPLLDEKGNRDEKKLQDKSDKNKTKKGNGEL